MGGGLRLVAAEVVGTGASEISGNTASTAGGGLSIVRSQIAGLLVQGNEAQRGGGVHVSQLDGTEGRAASSLDDLALDANVAARGGGLYVAPGESVTLIQGAVTGNEATELGAGALVPGGAHMDSLAVDWGVAASDNSTYDVELPDVGANGVQHDAYGAGASFICDGDVGCDER